MATKKTSSGGKTGSKTRKQPAREPGFFSDYGGSGITNVILPNGQPLKKSSSKKK